MSPTTPKARPRASDASGVTGRLRGKARTLTSRIRYELKRDPDVVADGGWVHHVVPERGGWAVKPEGWQDPVFVAATKDRAVQKAISMARRREGTLVIHRTDGTIQEHRNYAPHEELQEGRGS